MVHFDESIAVWTVFCREIKPTRLTGEPARQQANEHRRGGPGNSPVAGPADDLPDGAQCLCDGIAAGTAQGSITAGPFQGPGGRVQFPAVFLFAGVGAIWERKPGDQAYPLVLHSRDPRGGGGGGGDDDGGACAEPRGRHDCWAVDEFCPCYPQANNRTGCALRTIKSVNAYTRLSRRSGESVEPCRFRRSRPGITG
jgi:hypothetical protein